MFVLVVKLCIQKKFARSQREEVARKLGPKLKLENIDVTSIHGMNTEKMV
jgi:hypothetical protein